jgi:hypothetical protein
MEETTESPAVAEAPAVETVSEPAATEAAEATSAGPCRGSPCRGSRYIRHVWMGRLGRKARSLSRRDSRLG